MPGRNQAGLPGLGLQGPRATWPEPAGPCGVTPLLAGMVLAVLLYHGRLPRLFRRNLLYSQRSKYRTPRRKPAPGPGAAQTPAEGRSSWEPGAEGAQTRTPLSPKTSCQ